ncbi:MAG: hypothetical protein IJR14_07695 [Synergistaceae bacterium]|nr:hypothetical protein [Synergistaceae bacterium]
MMKANLMVRLDEDERAWLEAEAARQERSLANMIRWIMRRYREEASKSSSGAISAMIPSSSSMKRTLS